jgi:hypothetical protein
MLEAPHTAVEQKLVNLAALQCSLKEMAAKIKSPDHPANDRPVEIQGPTLVIRGK